ncbi:DUF1266 domain-containing protein, partial [Salmonella enterica subsp. enterica serovar Virginia]|nr:DUF1266 domain-containing protein [Salmonella enterica subsp. enterica serovar Virginia]
FDLESSWGIENRDELLQTISRMTDDGHATQLEWLYRRWFRYAWVNRRCHSAENGVSFATSFALQTCLILTYAHSLIIFHRQAFIV